MKKIRTVSQVPEPHWVGDGFPVRSLFTYNSKLVSQLSPFLLLDYAGPTEFEPATQARGVGQHPHRGFETVTIVYQGELEHRDSSGAGDTIGAGDVQWMTAAGGIVHDEFHSEAFTRSGGTLEMVQLWVNLPAQHKMSAPGYQTLRNRDIPVAGLPKYAGTMRIIAGEYAGHTGSAQTFTPMNVWDIRLKQDKTASFEVAENHTSLLIVLHGTVLINGRGIAREAQMVLMGNEGSEIRIEAYSDANLLLLSGEPIDEPVVGHGPFVMNTKAEIRQAVKDYSSGKFGPIPG